jgi:hypothetical protein
VVWGGGERGEGRGGWWLYIFSRFKHGESRWLAERTKLDRASFMPRVENLPKTTARVLSVCLSVYLSVCLVSFFFLPVTEGEL